jgi:type IX secretion system PorP/SprF family membrane protein
MRKFFCVILLSICFGVKAQDVHFTQWMHAPQTYAPSSIGDFDGKFRFHGNYRNQWSSVTVPFVTFAMMAESNSINSIPGLGVKAGIVYDITGDSKFSTTHIDLGAGYTIPLNYSLGEFRIGVQPTITQKKIDLTALTFDSQYNGYFFDSSLGSGENIPRLSRWYLDMSIGFQYKLRINKKFKAKTSFALFNIFTPKQSFFNNDEIFLDRRWSWQVSGKYQLNDKLELQPGVQVSVQGKFNAINFGSLLDYNLSKTKYFKQSIFFGTYFRAVDSGDLIVGINYDRLKAAISYDINYSGLTPASNYKGGVELAVIYIIPYPKKLPQFKFCPVH